MGAGGGDPAFGVIAGFLIVVAAVTVPEFALRYVGVDQTDEGALVMAARPAHWKVVIAATAGTTEEVLFRGYLIERTLEPTGARRLRGWPRR